MNWREHLPGQVHGFNLVVSARRSLQTVGVVLTKALTPEPRIQLSIFTSWVVAAVELS